MKAHVFQIDPATKRNWIPASKHAVTVSFFYDAGRSVYRIISVGGTKAIINSTITPNMTFTKTSQKFGQWADSRANTFKEFKEAARLVRDKSQEKFELLSPGLNISSPQVNTAARFRYHARAFHSIAINALTIAQRSDWPLLANLSHSPFVTHSSRNDHAYYSGLRLFRSKSADMEESTEKEQMRKMLSEGSICERNSEAELFSLRDSNAKLVAALHEANSSIDQWKKQLAEYQEETDRLREQVADLEAQSGVSASSETGNDELTQTMAEMEALIRAKDEEIKILRGKKPDLSELEKEREEACQRIQDAQTRAESAVQKVIETLDVKIYDLSDLRQNLAKLLEK
ncbi:hypothetical protein H4Q32_023727 [Labeo rohita]|uniref:WH1 domain-containing protein n=1 Tax=Labeo rohita TaxID=84645 RepID=A0ABQ8M965_LABRO|nr:hypothetical protein H4Q32_023727 [Labeo rohita]